MPILPDDRDHTSVGHTFRKVWEHTSRLTCIIQFHLRHPDGHERIEKDDVEEEEEEEEEEVEGEEEEAEEEEEEEEEDEDKGEEEEEEEEEEEREREL